MAEETVFVLGYDPGSAHRWMALLAFTGSVGQPDLCDFSELGEGREEVATRIDECIRASPGRLVVAVETPKGVPFGKSVAEIKARGRDALATSLAAERFASIAWTKGLAVHQHSAAEVRAKLCLGEKATDAQVRAALEANVQNVAKNVHARDAMAIALFVGAPLVGYEIRHGAPLVKARAKDAAKAKVRKFEPSVQKAMIEQGFGHLLGGGDGKRSAR